MERKERRWGIEGSLRSVSPERVGMARRRIDFPSSLHCFESGYRCSSFPPLPIVFQLLSTCFETSVPSKAIRVATSLLPQLKIQVNNSQNQNAISPLETNLEDSHGLGCKYIVFSAYSHQRHLQNVSYAFRHQSQCFVVAFLFFHASRTYPSTRSAYNSTHKAVRAKEKIFAIACTSCIKLLFDASTQLAPPAFIE